MEDGLKDFILTEKPSVALDFYKALQERHGGGEKKQGYFSTKSADITWALGHLLELFYPEDYDPSFKKWTFSTLPIIPKSPQYKIIPRVQSQFKVIEKLLKNARKYRRIIIATDAGREGELIARTLLGQIRLHLLEKNKKFTYPELYRFWTSQALSREVIDDGLKEIKPLKEYNGTFFAGKARQLSDWLVGINLSRAATLRLNDLYTVGRVQTAVLSLLVDRAREIENFKPKPYWKIRGQFPFPAYWGRFEKNEKKLKFQTHFEGKDLLEKHLALLSKTLKVKDAFYVDHLEKKKQTQAPPELYSLTDLQKEANIRFHFSAKKTLDLAQSLYEKHKCLSYPRTDSKVMGSKNLDIIISLKKNFEKKYPDLFSAFEPWRLSLKNKALFNDSKLTDHHALIPLKDPKGGKLSSDEEKIFDLVLRRFAAVLSRDMIYETTELHIKIKNKVENKVEHFEGRDFLFLAKGKIILDLGWKLSLQSLSLGDKLDDIILPPILKSSFLTLESVKKEDHKTSPPPHYSEALLLSDMTNPARLLPDEEKDLKRIYRGDVGLGTQSTRAQIIETLLDRKYTERSSDKRLVATDKGKRLIDFIRKHPRSSVLASPSETARWELGLNEIAHLPDIQKTGDAANEFLNHISFFVKESIQELRN